VPGKRAQLMTQMANQLIRFIDGVHDEGGVRRAVFEFPSDPVVCVVMRKDEYEALGSPESTKGPHKFTEQMMIEKRCGWCGERQNHHTHSGF
jgi:hypothetical protein